MIIDFHSHMTAPAFSTAEFPIEWNQLLQNQREAGIDINVLSNPMVLDTADRVHLDRTKAVALFHDYLASSAKAHKGNFLFMAYANVPGGKEAVSEVKRVLGDPNCVGILVNSNYFGIYPDAQEYKDFYSLACDADMPIFIHPPFRGIGFDKAQLYHLRSIFARPADVSLAVLRLILSGVLEEFAKLKVVCAYSGGMLPMLGLRMDYQCDTPGLRAEEKYAATLTKPPSAYMKENLYLDTATMSREAIMCAISVVGEERVLFGTDYPPAGLHPKKYVSAVGELSISDAAKKAILGGNAARLLKLKESVLA